LREPTSPDEQMANLLLFVPLGLFGALATRRAVWTAVAGAALSFGIEGWQAVSDVRVATAGDWVYNSGGALIGAGAGLVLLAVGAMARPRTVAQAQPPAVVPPRSVPRPLVPPRSVPRPLVPPPSAPRPLVPPASASPRTAAGRSWSPALEPTLVLTPAVEDETTLNLTR
jgi:hypothetical protein